MYIVSNHVYLAVKAFLIRCQQFLFRSQNMCISTPKHVYFAVKTFVFRCQSMCIRLTKNRISLSKYVYFAIKACVFRCQSICMSLSNHVYFVGKACVFCCQSRIKIKDLCARVCVRAYKINPKGSSQIHYKRIHLSEPHPERHSKVT